MTNELRELLEAYHCKDVVTQDLIDRIDAEFQRLQQDKSDLLELLVDARKEIELLRAIVDRLPKTADGVPVVPGMTVWNGRIHTGTSERIGDLVLVAENYGNSQWKDGMIDADQCYSTREAAEAARTKLTTGETGEG